jgi:hypothetical protein
MCVSVCPVGGIRILIIMNPELVLISYIFKYPF